MHHLSQYVLQGRRKVFCIGGAKKLQTLGELCMRSHASRPRGYMYVCTCILRIKRSLVARQRSPSGMDDKVVTNEQQKRGALAPVAPPCSYAPVLLAKTIAISIE